MRQSLSNLYIDYGSLPLKMHFHPLKALERNMLLWKEVNYFFKTYYYLFILSFTLNEQDVKTKRIVLNLFIVTNEREVYEHRFTLDRCDVSIQ